MALILDNAFTDDTYDMRGDRLSLISANVDTYAAELALPDDLKNWGLGAYAAWESALVTAGIERGQRDTAFETYQRLFDELRDGYIRVKELLWALIEDTEDGTQIAEQYDIIQQTPRTRRTLKVSAEQIKETSDILRAEGDPRVLAEPIIDTLIAKTDAMETAWQTAQTEKKESLAAYDTLAALYNEDAQKLRLVYNYATLSWGKYDPKLFLLGFAPSVVRPGGGQPDAPTGLACDVETKTFSWDVVAEATSYQLAFSADRKVWDEAYAGSETSVVFDPGAGEWKFRVRARDVDGFGDWSGVIVVNFSGGALPAPTGFGFDNDFQKFFWDSVVGALMYQLEISRDDGATWTQVYDDVDTYFDASLLEPGDALARVRAIDGYMEPGDWSDPPLAVTFRLRTPTMLIYDQYRNQFTWDFIPGADGYEFELDDSGGGGFVQIYSGPNNHFVHALAKGTYKFRAHAERGAEQSGWSNEFETVILFAAPANLHYDSGAHKIKWDKVPGAAQYQLVNEMGSVNYIGAKNEFGDMPSEPQQYRVRAGDGTMLVWGEWSAWTQLG